MSDGLDCGCTNFEQCLIILNLMLDNESTLVQEHFFFKHIENCIVCFSHYNVEKQIRQLIKTKLNNKTIPFPLANEIREKIIPL